MKLMTGNSLPFSCFFVVFSISITRQSIKKLGKFSGHNLDKAYLELKELGEIAKFDKRVANKKNKELNAPSYSYYVAKMEIDGSIVHFQFNVRESPDRSPMLYAIQEIKNGGVVPGNNSSLAPSRGSTSGTNGSGFALAPATNNIPKAKKDVKLESGLPTKDNNGAERDFRELQEASRSLPDERVRLFHSGERLVDDGIRGVLSKVLGHEIKRFSDLRGYGSASLVNPNHKDVVFEIVRRSIKGWRTT